MIWNKLLPVYVLHSVEQDSIRIPPAFLHWGALALDALETGAIVSRR